MNVDRNNKDFLQIKALYKQLRWEQRKIIIRYLESQGFTIIGKYGGHGICKYTSGNRFKSPYDLSNWLWIIVKIDERMAMISLQCFDQDPNSKNYHVLMDRLGFFMFHEASELKESYKLMENTDIDLPLDDDKLQKLSKLLIQKLE